MGKFFLRVKTLSCRIKTSSPTSRSVSEPISGFDIRRIIGSVFDWVKKIISHLRRLGK